VVSRPWLDYLKRSLFAKGELRHLIERDGLKGLTSNPSIFEKARRITIVACNRPRETEFRAARRYRRMRDFGQRRGAKRLRKMPVEAVALKQTT
jgi:transaldolase